MEPIFGAIIVILIYFIPSIIAFNRDHSSKWGIFLTNLLFGWSGLGWIIALIWSASSKGQTIVVNNVVSK